MALTLHELEVAAANAIQRVGQYSTQIKKEIKAIKSMENMITRQTKALAALKDRTTVLVPIEEFKRLKVALFLNKANLEAAKTRLREVTNQMSMAKDQLQTISKAKESAVPKILQFHGRPTT
jgi:hypothetical protein